MPKSYPTLTDNALTTLTDRYFQPGEDFDGLCGRVAGFVAGAEHPAKAGHWATQFYDGMRGLRWLPSSPVLFNAGTAMKCLPACYVLPIDDDLDDIFARVKDAAMITQSGGGIGYAFSRLRPSDAVVASSGGRASGPVSFIKPFDTAAEVVKAGGRRRAAQMGVLSVHHPDVLDFIDVKAADNTSYPNFNLSVALTDKFMNCVKYGAAYPLFDPRDPDNPVGWLDARQVWRRLAERAWVGGDPGCVWIDRANAAHANPHLGTIETPNACSESFMLPWETCILGSVNLAAHVRGVGPGAHTDWPGLRESVYQLVRFLDNTIDVSDYPLGAIADRTKSTRRIGAGVMGLADALIDLGLKYDSPEAVAWTGQMMQYFQACVHDASQRLAEERGVYPAWTGSRFAARGKAMRNTDPVVIAPTGTISIIAGVSSGIEPLFARSFTRNVLDGKKLVETHKRLGVVDDDLLVTAHEIAPEWHVKMQAAVQRYTDNAVSKTCNLPNDATVEDIEDVYWQAWEAGLRSISVYRDGAKGGQVLTSSSRAANTAVCPECAAAMVFAEGCSKCPNCGYSKCEV